MSVLYRIDELRRLEARAQAQLPHGTLMQRAGLSAAEWIRAWLAQAAPPGARGGPALVLVLCGPGNNGGDGFACAAALARMGIACACWAPRDSGSEEARAARAAWSGVAQGRILTELPDARGVVLAVDALFGIGAQRPLDGDYLQALRWVQEHRIPLLALDVPSGLNAQTGAWLGAVAGARALHTLTFLGDKPGLHTLEGIDAAGTVSVAGLGVSDPSPEAAGRLSSPGCFTACLQPRAANSNKGDFGAVAVVGGASGMVGAALLAARAALRLGAGKVYVCCLGAPQLGVDPLQPELMFRVWPHLPDADVLVAGCGLGGDATAREALERAIAHEGGLVLDADALNLLAGDTRLAAQLRAHTAAQAAATVLTPHPAEAARLLQSDTSAVQADRVQAALTLARSFGTIVVLKGAGSIIAAPPHAAAAQGRYWINTTGSAALASAGTGDVLAGMIGALLAQAPHAASAGDEAALQAVLAAVWLHGQAAARSRRRIGLTASDIAPLAARELSRLIARGAAPDAG